ncbi:hypothetical protein [Pseudolactococcus reticulitermitis]|uniref:Uncharacterized protein n=1 Tax=Pseudolactococcus reticulitermitis TaxID=2025039 RepID=A0A224WVW5_9LACT|nr:hypothetical protein [Lactococcus reticulitermitis]GAX46508.1 hypothetical protein RsY01_87 [Lactococcus reticulitermitis]
MATQNIEQEKQEEQKKKRKKGLLILLLLLLLSGTGYSLYHVFRPKPRENVSIISGDFLPDGKDAKKMSDKELADTAQKKVDDSRFNMMIASTAKIDTQTQQGTLNIKNPQTNRYPINVVITDDQNGDVIYTSGAIEPGEEVNHVQLEKTLAKGTHQATARFSLYDPKTKAKKGEVAAGVSVIVD